MSNRYVSFVSDSDFLECVKWVCEAYPSEIERTELDFLKETSVDYFKMLFDMFNGDLNVENWLKKEKLRQADKTVNNRIGDFHQMLLGKVDGWQDLGRGHKLGIDLKKSDDSVFIELKNKFNTMNSSSQSRCWDKLEAILEKYPKATAYWAYIISKHGDSGEKVWEYRRHGETFVNNKIKVIWGKNVYELVTGNPNALEETWNALPLAINDLIGSNVVINSKDQKILLELSKHVFR